MINVEVFEEQWVRLARIICREVYADPLVKTMREKLLKDGFLTLEEKNQFILVCDGIKNKILDEEFGQPGGERFEEFRRHWQEWFKVKSGRHYEGDGGPAEPVVNHILFGSTPDPETFLREYGSLKEE